MIKSILNFLFGSRTSYVERYLSGSSDLVELEQRQKKLARKGIY